MYNVSGLGNSLGMVELLNGVNSVSGGLFVPVVFLFSFYIILLVSFRRADRDWADVFLSSNTIITIVGLVLWGVGLLSTVVFSFLIFLFAASLLAKIMIGN